MESTNHPTLMSKGTKYVMNPKTSPLQKINVGGVLVPRAGKDVEGVALPEAEAALLLKEKTIVKAGSKEAEAVDPAAAPVVVDDEEDDEDDDEPAEEAPKPARRSRNR